MALPTFTSVCPCPFFVKSSLVQPSPLDPEERPLKKKRSFLIHYPSKWDMRFMTFCDKDGNPTLHARIPANHPFFVKYNFTQKHTPAKVKELIYQALQTE